MGDGAGAAVRRLQCCAGLGSSLASLQALRRLQLAAEQSRCLAVLFRRAGDASCRIARGAANWSAVRASRCARRCEILKSRGARPGTRDPAARALIPVPGRRAAAIVRSVTGTQNRGASLHNVAGRRRTPTGRREYTCPH